GMVRGDRLRAVRHTPPGTGDEDRLLTAGSVGEGGALVIGGEESSAPAVGEERLEIEEVEAEPADEDPFTGRQAIDGGLGRQPGRQIGEAGGAGETLPFGPFIAHGGGDVAHAEDDGVDVEA